MYGHSDWQDSDFCQTFEILSVKPTNLVFQEHWVPQPTLRFSADPKAFYFVFSAPEPKAQVHYCDHVLSVVCLSVVHPSFTFHIFDFSSETAEKNSTKLDRKQDLNVLYRVCVFLGRSEKQDGHPGLWLAEAFLTSLLKRLNGIQWNLKGNKISTSSTKFGFFGLIGKTRWPPWPLIGCDIFNCGSETAEQNSRKLDRKQDSDETIIADVAESIAETQPISINRIQNFESINR